MKLLAVKKSIEKLLSRYHMGETSAARVLNTMKNLRDYVDDIISGIETDVEMQK